MLALLFNSIHYLFIECSNGGNALKQEAAAAADLKTYNQAKGAYWYERSPDEASCVAFIKLSSPVSSRVYNLQEKQNWFFAQNWIFVPFEQRESSGRFPGSQFSTAKN